MLLSVLAVLLALLPSCSARRLLHFTPHPIARNQANATHFSLTAISEEEALACLNQCKDPRYDPAEEEYDSDCLSENCPAVYYCRSHCTNMVPIQYWTCSKKCSSPLQECLEKCEDDAKAEAASCLAACPAKANSVDVQAVTDCKSRCRSGFARTHNKDKCQERCASYGEKCPLDSHSDWIEYCKKMEDDCGDPDHNGYDTTEECEANFPTYCKKEADAICPASKVWLIVVIALLAVAAVAIIVILIIFLVYRCRHRKPYGKKKKKKSKKGETDTSGGNEEDLYQPLGQGAEEPRKADAEQGGFDGESAEKESPDQTPSS